MDFSANINPLGISPKGREALHDWQALIQHYPEPYQPSLREHLARYYGLPVGNIAAGNGATEFLYTLCLHIRPLRVWTVAPTFSEYARAGMAAGAEIVSTPRENLVARATSDLSRNDIVCLCTPNNPDGVILSVDSVAQWVNLTRQRGAYLVIDESFGDFDASLPSYRLQTVQECHVFVLQSLTKFWAIPGLRLGALFAHHTHIERILAHTDQWNVNVLAAAYMMAALADRDYISATRRLIAAEKERMYRRYLQIDGMEVVPPSVNFMLMRLPVGLTANALANRLANQGLLIRNCDNYDGLSDRHIRIAIRTPQENDRLFGAISQEIRALQKEATD